MAYGGNQPIHIDLQLGNYTQGPLQMVTILCVHNITTKGT